MAFFPQLPTSKSAIFQIIGPGNLVLRLCLFQRLPVALQPIEYSVLVLQRSLWANIFLRLVTIFFLILVVNTPYHFAIAFFKIPRKQSVPTTYGEWGYWRLLSHDHVCDFKWTMQWWRLDFGHEDWWQSGSSLTLSVVARPYLMKRTCLQFPVFFSISWFSFSYKLTVGTVSIHMI